MTRFTCFTACDVRGRLGLDLDAGIARRIGRAFAEVLGARRHGRPRPPRGLEHPGRRRGGGRPRRAGPHRTRLPQAGAPRLPRRLRDEMSAHHYFRDIACCDSGMIPWLLVADLLSRRDAPLADLWEARHRAFPSSGEVNFPVNDAPATVARAVEALEPEAEARDDTDGTSLSFKTWRFNLRASNAEPLLRLNVEARGNEGLVNEDLRRVTALIGA